MSGVSESQISLVHIAVRYYRCVLKEAEQARRAMEKKKVRAVSEENVRSGVEGEEESQDGVEGEDKTQGMSEESEQTQNETDKAEQKQDGKEESKQTQNEKDTVKQTRVVSKTMKGVWQMYSLERAAAYNLCLILQNSGANAMAMEIRQRYLVVE